MSAPDTLPGLNLREAIERLGGREALLLKQLKRFAEQQPAAVEDIRQKVAQGAHEEAARLAHSLKGLAATLGCDALSKQARIVESHLKNGLSPDLETLQATLAQALDSIRELPMPEQAPTACPPTAALGLDERINGLLEGLRHRDFSVIAVFEQMEDELKDRFSSVAMQRLSASIRGYDLAAAAQALETLLEEATGPET